MNRAWLPDLIYMNGRFESGRAIVCDDAGKIVAISEADSVPDAIRLSNRALLPGLVNAHSHAFQRVIRGRTEYRSQSTDSFWTWREQMYATANRLGPEEIYAASRMAFLEMALTGITAVGEFHYIHHAPDGSVYSDPNLLAREVIRAARNVGIRIALLRVAYARAGFETEANPLQVRFIEDSPETYLKHLERLLDAPELKDEMAWAGVAPHSVRAVPLDYLRPIIAFANERELPVHMHVAEQRAEVEACIQEYGRSPVALLETEGLLSKRFTAVHAIHVTPKAIGAIARAGAFVCACPTTERNLGDGVVPVDSYFDAGVRVSLGSDSQIQIDLLEDARELEYHLRLQKTARNVLAPRGRRAVRPSRSGCLIAPPSMERRALVSRAASSNPARRQISSPSISTILRLRARRLTIYSPTSSSHFRERQCATWSWRGTNRGRRKTRASGRNRGRL